jgi:DNA-directed RNA polymerase sigma subunit (sigma70/sigma32)
MERNDKDFNLKISVRNARLLNAVRAKYDSVANMARQGNLTISRVNSLMTMKLKPVDMRGQWRDIALDVAGMLECDPEDLWPDHIKNVKLDKSTAEMTMNFEAVMQIAKSSGPAHLERCETVDALMDSLTPIEAKVLNMRYQLEESYTDIAKEVGRTGNRVAQIEAKAVNKMRQNAIRKGFIKIDYDAQNDGKRVNRRAGIMSDIFDE